MLHEDQVTDDRLQGYQALVLCDVKLLPAETARHIEAFVRRGGVLIADCVPQMDARKERMDSLLKLFGVSQAGTDRIVQAGHWVPYAPREPGMVFAPPDGTAAPEVRTDAVAGKAFGHRFAFKVVSPRPCAVSGGKALLPMKSGRQALIRRKAGRGSAWLFGFCLQDTYFQMWKEDDTAAREQLGELIGSLLEATKIRPHVHLSNPDIEAGPMVTTILVLRLGSSIGIANRITSAPSLQRKTCRPALPGWRRWCAQCRTAPRA